MTTEVRTLLASRPFEPFSIVTSGGSRYRVATPDHADVNPRGTRAIIWFDDDGSVTVSAMHMVAIEKESASKSGAA